MFDILYITIRYSVTEHGVTEVETLIGFEHFRRIMNSQTVYILYLHAPNTENNRFFRIYVAYGDFEKSYELKANPRINSENVVIGIAN